MAIRLPKSPKKWISPVLIATLLGATACAGQRGQGESIETSLTPNFRLSASQTHSKFSRSIEPAISVPSGSVVEVFTHEATGGQLDIDSADDDLATVDMDLVHALTGPVFIEGAEAGDTLAVELLQIEPADWAWMAIIPHFGLLTDDFGDTTKLRTFSLNNDQGYVDFSDNIRVPLRPFAGVMGVAPDTDEMLNTIPPIANGGNLDDPNLTVGTTVYFPVFVDGALFSIGDTHAVQGLGEVSGTAMEAPMRIVYKISVLKNARQIQEVQYETADYYATTGFAETIDEAAQKATRFMVEYLVDTRGLSREDAYMLCSIAGNLHIAEAVDIPHMLVTMHMPKSIFLE
ncbi:MAG: acetamidase/formamidase family protein [Woeseia sp.]